MSNDDVPQTTRLPGGADAPDGYEAIKPRPDGELILVEERGFYVSKPLAKALREATSDERRAWVAKWAQAVRQ